MVSILEFIQNILDGIEASKKNFSQRIKTLDKIGDHEDALIEHILKIILFGKDSTLMKQLFNITYQIFSKITKYKKRIKNKDFYEYLRPGYLNEKGNKDDYYRSIKIELSEYINEYPNNESRYSLIYLQNYNNLEKIINNIRKFYDAFILDLSNKVYDKKKIEEYIDKYLIGE
jgi:hypothetical protein